MEITGNNLIGNILSSEGTGSFLAVNPATGAKLPGSFSEAGHDEIDMAVIMAEKAFPVYREKKGMERAHFLEAIADEIMDLGDLLIARCQDETGLPETRLIGERGRTINQLKLFAGLLKDGNWVNARIDRADPARKPVPKPDIRQMQIALGPVGIFGASNFPLAFSVAGGDTASALAAGCPVVVKAHPAHPGTSEIVGKAILAAAVKTGMPEGVFSLLQGRSNGVGSSLVKHPLIKAIGFTGSFNGGKALWDEAAKRAEPIPVYAEMGSINPIFILEEALRENGPTIAKGLIGSINLGVGQFCTNPGVVIVPETKETDRFIDEAARLMGAAEAGIMLTETIKHSFDVKLKSLADTGKVVPVARGLDMPSTCHGQPALLVADGTDFLQRKELQREIFGPSSLIVRVRDYGQMLQIAKNMEGQLTATIHAEGKELTDHMGLIKVLERKVGRLIINGFPTGVEVCHAMVHGGPYPATTDAHITSVGTAAIYRFSRPVCYQEFPDSLLPDELKESNPLGILRLLDGAYSRS